MFKKIFIGLVDKNGKRICEGDTVRRQYPLGIQEGVVRYLAPSFGLEIEEKGKKYIQEFTLYFWNECEVVDPQTIK
jgi:hypothetical protein